MKQFSVTVMAGRYDADEKAVTGAFARETQRPEHPLIFTTEQGLKARAQALTHPGYGLARCAIEGRQAEQVVLYPQADWTPMDRPHVLELTTGGGHFSQRFPIYATVQLLRHTSQHPLAAIAVHMPSHLDKASKFYFPVNLILWRHALTVLAHEVARLRRQHPGIAVIVGGDWNARQTGGSWTGKALRHSLPGFRAGQGDLFGNVWTLGLTSVGQPVTVQPRGSSDHTIKRFVYQFGSKP